MPGSCRAFFVLSSCWPLAAESVLNPRSPKIGLNSSKVRKEIERGIIGILGGQRAVEARGLARPRQQCRSETPAARARRQSKFQSQSAAGAARQSGWGDSGRAREAAAAVCDWRGPSRLRRSGTLKTETRQAKPSSKRSKSNGRSLFDAFARLIRRGARGRTQLVAIQSRGTSPRREAKEMRLRHGSKAWASISRRPNHCFPPARPRFVKQ